MLLGPAGARTAEGLVVVGAGSDDFAGGVHDERAGAAGTNVDAEISDVASSRFPLELARAARCR